MKSILNGSLERNANGAGEELPSANGNRGNLADEAGMVFGDLRSGTKWPGSNNF
jgi:hypothetical protein